MKDGKSIILLNLDPIYESLYDVLNQYHASLGGKRFVEIGFGNHKTLVEVHKDFRLVVIAEIEDAKKFPIPLLNRLEKHCLNYTTLITDEEKEAMKVIEIWVTNFTSKLPKLEKKSAIIKGYGGDTISTLLANEENEDDPNTRVKSVKKNLVKLSSIESVIQNNDELALDLELDVKEIYSKQRDIFQVLKTYSDKRWLQIVTHSCLLNEMDLEKRKEYNIDLNMIESFDSEYEFERKLSDSKNRDKILILQTDNYDTRLLASIRFNLENATDSYKQFVVIVKIRRNESNFIIFSYKWECLYVDQLRPPTFNNSISALMKYSLAQIFERSTEQGIEELDCECVIAECLSKACCKLYDGRKNTTNLRREILQEFRKDGDFLKGLKNIITELLLKKEKEATHYDHTNWIKSRVATNESVVKAGTFQKACENYIINKVEDVLAYALAWCEKNYNLSLLEKEPKKWIKILCHDSIKKEAVIDLSHLFSTSQTQNSNDKHIFDFIENLLERDVFIQHILTTDANMSLPFSWIIFDKVSHVVEFSQKLNRNAIADNLKKEPFHSLFDSLFDNWYELYLEDAIPMLHEALTENHESEYEVRKHDI